MSVVQIKLPDEVQEAIDRQVAEGHAVDVAEWLVEAARRYAEDLDLENELVVEARVGIADVQAGNVRTVSTHAGLAVMEAETMARARARLMADKG